MDQMKTNICPIRIGLDDPHWKFIRWAFHLTAIVSNPANPFSNLSLENLVTYFERCNHQKAK